MASDDINSIWRKLRLNKQPLDLYQKMKPFSRQEIHLVFGMKRIWNIKIQRIGFRIITFLDENFLRKMFRGINKPRNFQERHVIKNNRQSFNFSFCIFITASALTPRLTGPISSFLLQRSSWFMRRDMIRCA